MTTCDKTDKYYARLQQLNIPNVFAVEQISAKYNQSILAFLKRDISKYTPETSFLFAYVYHHICIKKDTDSNSDKIILETYNVVINVLLDDNDNNNDDNDFYQFFYSYPGPEPAQPDNHTNFTNLVYDETFIKDEEMPWATEAVHCHGFKCRQQYADGEYCVGCYEIEELYSASSICKFMKWSMSFQEIPRQKIICIYKTSIPITFTVTEWNKHFYHSEENLHINNYYSYLIWLLNRDYMKNNNPELISSATKYIETKMAEFQEMKQKKKQQEKMLESEIHQLCLSIDSNTEQITKYKNTKNTIDCSISKIYHLNGESKAHKDQFAELQKRMEEIQNTSNNLLKCISQKESDIIAQETTISILQPELTLIDINGVHKENEQLYKVISQKKDEIKALWR